MKPRSLDDQPDADAPVAWVWDPRARCYGCLRDWAITAAELTS